MSNPYKHGRWVKFDGKVDGAHHTSGGKTVGIYQAPREGVIVNGVVREERTVPHVVVVRPDGTNLMRMADDGQSLVKVALDPADCKGLEAADVPADLPDCDRNAHLFR